MTLMKTKYQIDNIPLEKESKKYLNTARDCLRIRKLPSIKSGGSTLIKIKRCLKNFQIEKEIIM